MRASSLCLTVTTVFLIGTAAASGSERTIGTGEFGVVDGDTLEIGGERMDLADIVAPEPGRQCLLSGSPRDCGDIARTALLDLTAGAIVECTAVGSGDDTSYRCRANGYDLSEGMVYTGWALPLEGAPERYWSVLETAMERPRGFWRGDFIDPWAPLSTVLAGQ